MCVMKFVIFVGFSDSVVVEVVVIRLLWISLSIVFWIILV